MESGVNETESDGRPRFDLSCGVLRIAKVPAWAFILGLSLLGDLTAQELQYRKEYHSPKLEGTLAGLCRDWTAGKMALAKRTATSSGIQIDAADRIEVVLVPERGQQSSTVDQAGLLALGAEVTSQSRHFVEAMAPVDALHGLTEVAGVRFVRRPIRPWPEESVSEGSQKIGIGEARRGGHAGLGTKVAVIDGGFEKAIEARSAGDLPGFWHEMDFTGRGLYTGGHHGTACAEIVYDIAPGAELYLMKVASLSQLELAKDVAIQEGMDVVTMSLGWFGYGYGDGKGRTCQFVNEAFANGILWVKSAGNYASSTYWGDIVDKNQDGFHEFEGSRQVLEILNVKAGQSVNIWLTWYDWPVTQVDCDLLLYRLGADGSADLVAESSTNQTYDDAQEHLNYSPVVDGTYALAVWKDPKAKDVRIKVVSRHSLKGQRDVPESISVPADAEGALAVGAVDYRAWEGGPVEYFSSRGPTFDGRIKPDLVGPDRVSSYSYGTNSFPGTSAASPHIAGAAALLKSTNPGYYTADELRDALTGATVDMGAPGQDNTYGWGRLDLSMIPIGEPAMRLSMLGLDFGEVVVGRSHTLTVSILNTGTASLVLADIDLTGSGDFSVSSSTLVVPPDRSQGALVVFSPTTTADKVGTLTLETNLPSNGTRALSLSGRGVGVLPPPAPRLALGVTQISFGTIEVGEAATRTLSVANLGSATLTVTAIESADEFVTVSPAKLSVPADEARAAYVTFVPRSSGDLQTELTIKSDDPDQAAYRVVVTGSATAVEEVFSLALLPALSGSQGSYAVGPNEAIPIHLGGTFLNGAVGFAGLLEYDPTQMAFVGFEAGSDIPEVHTPGPNRVTPSQVEITAASFGGAISQAEPDLGTVSFRTLEGFSSAIVRLKDGRIRRGSRFEYLAMPIVLQFAEQQSVSGDFDGDGRVTFSDFILFAAKYGKTSNDIAYEAKFDMDGNGRIGFEDFIVFAGTYGS